jgi:hypothetical protein
LSEKQLPCENSSQKSTESTEREIPFAYLAAAVAAAGGKVRITNMDLLRFQAGYKIEFGQDPDGALVLLLAHRPDTKYRPEKDPRFLPEKY